MAQNILFKKTEHDPYVYMFPLGVITALYGAIVWVLFQYKWISYFPKLQHGNYMFYGFLWSYVAGFLMTAIPKMIGGAPARVIEVAVAFLLIVVQTASGYFQNSNLYLFIAFAQTIFLFYFAFSRYLATRRIPFDGFYFIPAALLLAVTGIVLSLITENRNFFVLLSCEGFILNLILGLGSRLIPVISRIENAVVPMNTTPQMKNRIHYLLILVSVNAGLILQANDFQTAGTVLKVLGTVLAAFLSFKTFVKPVRWGASTIGLKLSSLMLIVGYLMSLGNPVFSLAGLHVAYIGGFSLLTVLVSTRVMLAHNGQDLKYELSSKRIVVVLLTMGAASALRYLAGINYLSILLSLSVLLFCAAMVIWYHKYLKIRCHH